MRLPPSYREFLQVTNGWDEYSHSCLRLMPLAEVGWTRDVDPELARIWDQLEDDPDSQDQWYLHQESMSGSLYRRSAESLGLQAGDECGPRQGMARRQAGDPGARSADPERRAGRRCCSM
ncbi:SMI1/KNR4 family protein [Streptosporangium canum]|uniref:SMI1/KNR4 family protein n=1 Tax=Streptosporangium canum TaxID=324952 RepID=UPI0037B0F3C4